jgi:hypothetical protein
MDMLMITDFFTSDEVPTYLKQQDELWEEWGNYLCFLPLE